MIRTYAGLLMDGREDNTPRCADTTGAPEGTRCSPTVSPHPQRDGDHPRGQLPRPRRPHHRERLIARLCRDAHRPDRPPPSTRLVDRIHALDAHAGQCSERQREVPNLLGCRWSQSVVDRPWHTSTARRRRLDGQCPDLESPRWWVFDPTRTGSPECAPGLVRRVTSEGHRARPIAGAVRARAWCARGERSRHPESGRKPGRTSSTK